MHINHFLLAALKCIPTSNTGRENEDEVEESDNEQEKEGKETD